MTIDRHGLIELQLHENCHLSEPMCEVSFLCLVAPNKCKLETLLTLMSQTVRELVNVILVISIVC